MVWFWADFDKESVSFFFFSFFFASNFASLSFEIFLLLFFFPFLFFIFCYFSLGSYNTIPVWSCCEWLLFLTLTSSSFIDESTKSSMQVIFFLFLFLTCIFCLYHLLSLSPGTQSSIFVSFVHFKNGPEYFTKRTANVFIPMMIFLLQSLVSGSFFLFFCVALRWFFLSFQLHWVRFQYSRILVIFSCFPDLALLLLLFAHFHYQHGTFFNDKFYLNITGVYSYYLYQVRQFSLIFKI